MSASSQGGSNVPASGAADPSMEDILASIRRILSEDEAAPAAPPPPAVPPPTLAPEPDPPAPGPAAANGHDDDEVFSLDSSMLVEEPRLPAPPVIAPPVIAPPVIAAPAPAAVPIPAAPYQASADELLGPAAAAAASSSLGALVRTLAERQSVAVYRGGPTLEDLVRDEMRPLLKAWLDQNLPPLVERLVRAEIERVVGRAVS